MQAQKFWVITVLQIGAVGLLGWFLATYKTPWNVQRYVGTLLTVVCVGFLVAARIQLGRSFSIKPEARELVTTGLYSKIRNPIYVFSTLMLVGLSLVVQKPQMWILPGVAVIAQTMRARREARVLEAAFGDAYREYRSKTWF